MFMTVVLTVWVFYTPLFRDNLGHYTFNYFVFYILLNAFYALIFSTQALAKTAFFTQVSDKTIGGTYMTLMNTVANIGVHWPSTLALFLIDVFSFKECNLVDNRTPWMPIENHHHHHLHQSSAKISPKFLLMMSENTCSTESDSIVSFIITFIDPFY